MVRYVVPVGELSADKSTWLLTHADQVAVLHDLADRLGFQVVR